MNISFSLSENENIIGVFSSNQSSELVINEINYNSSDEFDSEDWVEIYNSSGYDINLENYIFKDEDNSHQYFFPNNLVIEDGTYFVLCKDSSYI